MNLETYTRGQVARFAIEEAARHGGVNNMLAVAMVLRNRVMAGWGDWLDVAMTAPAKRASFYPPAIVDYRTGNIRSFLSRMDGIWTGTEEDLTGGAGLRTRSSLSLTSIRAWRMWDRYGFSSDSHMSCT